MELSKVAPTDAVMTLLWDFKLEMKFIKDLTRLYQDNSNKENAEGMTAYFRNKFEFFGIKAGPRRNLLKIALDENKEEITEHYLDIVKSLYSLPEREFHMCAMEIYERQKRKKYEVQDIQDIEFLIAMNSWWDSVDYIAKNILGAYLLMYPDQLKPTLSGFSISENMWLQRSTIIFQLGYKTKTKEDILFQQCMKFKDSNEFFLQKAIGWALREYAKTNPQSVLNFVNSALLKPLSHKEAIRNIVK